MQEAADKAVSPLVVANYFVVRAAENDKMLDIIQLVKLVYLAHGWCLGITGKPLLSSQVEAWRYGPVIPEVYYAFRQQGTVTRPFPMSVSALITKILCRKSPMNNKVVSGWWLVACH